MKKEASDFQVMDKMATKNMDIRMTGTIVKAQKVKAGGHVTFGVDADTLGVIMNQLATGENTHYIAMYVINKKQFQTIKSEHQQ